jgi:hypothetical protein
MAHYLFGVAPSDFVTFATTGLLLLMVSALAAFVPARKAMRMKIRGTGVFSTD